MSGTATLTWTSDRGFDLDLTADLEDIQLRFAAVPVPADGTAELAAGVELNKLDILFKCQAAIDGVPAQLQDATVSLNSGSLTLIAGLEDVENGLLYPLETEIPCSLPSGVPDSGGPRNTSPDEDDLDWGDETTFEQIAGDVPDVALLTEEREIDEPDEPADAPPKGFAALLDALKNLDETADEGEIPTEERTPVPRMAGQLLADGGQLGSDHLMSATQEAKSFLELLEKREELELEEEHRVDELAKGAADILATPLSWDAKATALSEWLIEQPAVADLFIDDESLSELLAQW